jgi:glycosyltransferase involved in cell wall biosynthesis
MSDNLTENDGAARSLRRLLIIGTLFYPHPAVNAVRATQWSRHLPEFGWKPIVLCRNYGHVATPEEIRENVHPAVEVEYLSPPAAEKPTQTTPHGRSTNLKVALANSVVGQFVVPDTALKFWRGERERALRAVKLHKPDVILTTSPAHSVHDLGLWLSQATGLPWVADFQDPYLIDVRYRPHGILGRSLYPIYERFARRIYDKAALITHAIPIHARWARIAYPKARHKIAILPNGVPSELYDDASPILSENGRISIRIIGSSGSNEIDNFTNLGVAVSALSKSGLDVELCHIGGKSENLRQLEQRFGNLLVTKGHVSHREALGYIAGADVLVCLLDSVRSKSLGLSSKLFEYLATGKPVVVINPTVPDQHLLHGLKGVQILKEPAVEEIIRVLKHSLTPSARAPQRQTEDFIKLYNRRSQTKFLARMLDELFYTDKGTGVEVTAT